MFDRKFTLLMGVLAAMTATAGIAVAASSPSVSTGSTSSVTNSSALLKGTVNPNGASTSYQFQWGLSQQYGFNGAIHSAGSGTKAVAVSVPAKNLVPGTIYHFRLTAQNRYGQTLGVDHTFKTTGPAPPDVVTGPASQIGTTYATATGLITPHGAATQWWIEYGLTSAYTVRTFGGTVAAGSVPVAIAQQLTGLAPGTMFHFRLVAQHGTAAAQVGADQTFMTFTWPRPASVVHARTTPGTARKAPYTFTTSGTVGGPSSIPAALGCTQDVIARFFLGKREVGATIMPVQPNCTFSGQTVFTRLPGSGKKHRTVKLRVMIRARGNGYFGLGDARPETVTLVG